MAYRDLSLWERHALIREGVANGIHNLAAIEAQYDAALQAKESEEVTIPVTTNEVIEQEESYPTAEVRLFGQGGGIHIKPSKRGTFTAAATKHGMGVQAFASKVLAHKENYSPAMVKKANFARNASKWHADGGVLGHQYGLGTWLASLFRTEEPVKTKTKMTRVSENTSPTSRVSTIYEDRLADASNVMYDPKTNIPYIPDKAVVVNNSTISTNALDSAAKYATIHNNTLEFAQNPILAHPKTRKISIEEAIGLPLQETHGGALPYNSITNTIANDSTKTAKQKKEALRALYNANVFTAYGEIPAGAFVNNYHWLTTDRTVHPLLDAYRYYAEGDYNRGDKKHTATVKATGAAALTGPLATWAQTSPYALQLKESYNKKSTGGPLYPFSFSKEPLPQVRY